jgi:hypothetical protein
LFKRIRIAILLYVLLFVALGQFLADRRATDWRNPLWVDVYPVNGSGTEATQAFIDSLGPDAFAAIEAFLAAQAQTFGIGLEQPVRVRRAEQLTAPLPPPPADRSALATILWSLKLRWFVTRLHWQSDAPTPDVTVFAVYQTGELGARVDRSTALRKGMIAIANLYAADSARGSNQMIIAHELLHTLGATDKYAPDSALPLYPAGYAEPDRRPRYPQVQAELMGGRIPLDAARAEIPDSLAEVVVGPATAVEIGWIRTAPAVP